MPNKEKKLLQLPLINYSLGVKFVSLQGIGLIKFNDIFILKYCISKAFSGNQTYVETYRIQRLGCASLAESQIFLRSGRFEEST
jgi:hypothetical protein